MSNISVRLVPITTGGAGTASVHVAMSGLVHGIGILLGTLETPDVAITDGLTAAPVLSDTAIAADTRYQPQVPVCDEDGAPIADAYGPPVVTGRLDIAVSGGGSNKAGQIVLVIER